MFQMVWCEWCKRYLKVENGLRIHDDVFHPEYFPEKGHC